MSQNAIEIYNEGYCYYTGSEGYPLNYNKALACFNEAASLGVSEAMNSLGIIYENGEIVTQNYALAAEWFYKAVQADSTNPFAAYNLGRVYSNGIGVAKNTDMAYEYCKQAIAACNGSKDSPYAESCYLIGCIFLHDYKAYNEAYPYFVEAAKYGNIPEAWYNLGWLSEQGAVPVKNSNRDTKSARDGMARGFYEEAANLGDADAMDAIGRLYCSYSMFDEARPWLERAANKGNQAAKNRLKIIDASAGDLLRKLFK